MNRTFEKNVDAPEDTTIAMLDNDESNNDFTDLPPELKMDEYDDDDDDEEQEDVDDEAENFAVN